MSGEYLGLVYVEDVLRDLLASTLLTLQQDTARLTRLVKRRSQEDSDALLSYLTQHEIPVRLGFAREPWEVPQVTITLATETEDRFLGDELMVRDRDLGPNADLDIDLFEEVPALPFDMAYSNLQDGPFPASGRIGIDDETLTYDADDGSSLHVVGRGANGTAKDVHMTGAQIVAKKLERDFGVHVLVTYRIDVIADNADVVLWLQTLLKAVLLISQDKLMEEGLSEFKLSGSDYSPRPSVYPQFIYMRTLVLSARVELPIPEELIEVLSVEQTPTITGTTP